MDIEQLCHFHKLSASSKEKLMIIFIQDRDIPNNVWIMRITILLVIAQSF